MDDVQPETEQAKRRRRRKGASKHKSGTWLEYIQGSDFGRHLLIGMSVVAVLYAALIVWESRWVTRHYGPIDMYATPAQIRYVLGPPDAIEDGGRLYRYDDNGRRMTVRFSPDGRTISVRCTAPPDNEPRCTPILGVDVGDLEDVVLLSLGMPTREVYSGNGKTMEYDGLGVRLRMQRLAVVELEARAGGGITGYVPRALWAMVP
jgi:hypothetical protein